MNDSVGVLAASDSAIRNALEELGIDYCCSGNRSLADAAAAEGLPIRSVLAAIEQGRLATGPAQRSWLDAPLSEVVAYIRREHRCVSIEVLAKTAVLFELIADAHVLDAELLEPMRQTFHRFINDVVPHVESEEHILFRMIEGEARDDDALREAIVSNFLEHVRLNDALRELRSGRAVLACVDDRNCRRLAAALAELEAHVHETMNLENFVVYPRAFADAPSAAAVH